MPWVVPVGTSTGLPGAEVLEAPQLLLPPPPRMCAMQDTSSSRPRDVVPPPSREALPVAPVSDASQATTKRETLTTVACRGDGLRVAKMWAGNCAQRL